MKKELQKQMDSMMNMTMEAITNNKKLEPALNELFKYAPQDEKYQFILLHEIANQYLHELLDIDSEFHDYSFEEGIDFKFVPFSFNWTTSQEPSHSLKDFH